MGSITELRPSGTASGTGWSAVPSGTLHGVTSDNSDATYALWSGTGTPLALTTPVDSPPAGERRHQVRLRARGEDGDAWWAVRMTSGQLIAGASTQFPSSPSTVLGSWGVGVPADGPIILSAYVAGQSAGVKIAELYIDVDSREAPTFTAQTVSGAGIVTTTITDTATPTLRAVSIDTDDLAQRQYRYWVTRGSTTVWDTGIVSGPAVERLTNPLANGAYVAHYQLWTTLGTNTAYASAIEDLPFTVAAIYVPRPLNPSVNPVLDSPFYEVQVCAPFVSNMDGDVGYVEIERADCVIDGVPASSTTIAIIGPLETDECGTWTDYSLPRTGLGGSCDHDAEQCCSFYRARTVGRINGSLVISGWSDVFDAGMPPGLIVMWPSTAASLPDGWLRTTALDGRYPKGITDATTQPGVTGGSDTHLHATTPHAHDLTHTHTTSGATSAAVGAVNSHDGAAGTTAIAATHTHTVPTPTQSASVVSGTTSPTIATGNNDPARLDVIFMESDGTPLGVPNGALALTPDIAPAGWSTYTNATDRFLRGAGTAGNGGATFASTLDNHTHGIGAHSHTGTSHNHPTQVSGSAASTMTLFAGPNNVVWAANHSHTVSYGLTDTAALASGGSGTSGNSSRGTSHEPPFRALRVRENTSGAPALPIGLICAWRGSLGSIPDNWQLCDGTNGTPDMFGRYPKGATASIGAAGGATTAHNHSSPSHTHTTTGHTHTMTIGAAVAGTSNTSATVTVSVATGTHSHTHGATASTTPTVGNSTSGTLQDNTTDPLHEQVAFVQMIEEPSPPEDPEIFCLDWDTDQHLIRTLGPSGAIWAPVLGRFTWDVPRPFSSTTGVDGTRFVTSAEPGGRNLKMEAAVESETELAELRAVLERPLVLISPSDSTETWAVPIAESVTIVKIGRIRKVTADFIATGPQPEPQLADVGS